jgi:hypothetical protein
MIRVEGPDTATLIKRTRHHMTTEMLALVQEALCTMMLDCPLQFDDEEHWLRQSRPGAESFGLYLSDGRQFHFRPHPKGHDATEIEVRDKYQVGTVVNMLSTREDIWTFFESLSVAEMQPV